MNSEGDDNTEYGRDLANRYSDDLRKSRMGYEHDLTDYYADQAQSFNFYGVCASGQMDLVHIPSILHTFDSTNQDLKKLRTRYAQTKKKIGSPGVLGST
ncbi:hypothetical protein L2E82_38284 [Cichorium intybus]|uniref:Uncharacterized protein n=1 Tax=Cichorium intybus TaxID=13427 RepID=A0ACB9AF94_CICIN|nr:hypothetical protein L2E82_38284 [Cichorium intybus]